MKSQRLSNPRSIFSGRRPNFTARKRLGLGLALPGLVIFILGAQPAWFGLDRSPVTGFVQIAVFLVGLAFIAIGGYISLRSLWMGHQLPISADFGARMVSTGYVISVASGMADVFGFGSESFPRIPDFGIWQARGVLFGEIVIAAGFLLLIPWRFFPSAENSNSGIPISVPDEGEGKAPPSDEEEEKT